MKFKELADKLNSSIGKIDPYLKKIKKYLEDLDFDNIEVTSENSIIFTFKDNEYEIYYLEGKWHIQRDDRDKTIEKSFKKISLQDIMRFTI